MSLEAQLEANTAALKELTAALLAIGTLQNAQAMTTPAVQAVVKAQKDADAKKLKTATDNAATAGNATAAPAGEAAEESKPSGEPSASTGATSSDAATLKPWHGKTAKLFAELNGGEPSLDNLRKAIIHINTQIGREQAEAVLGRFGAQMISPKEGIKKPHLDPDLYPQAFALCLEVLAGRTDATEAVMPE